MRLTKSYIKKSVATDNVIFPPASAISLPEKVLQFGTGVLLKGLPDFLIHKANCKGKFNGSIVMVKSTGTGDCSSISKQDGLYTVCVRGIKAGKKISENHIISSVSRCLSAATEWDSVLAVAANPEMQVVISNTTEVGIELVKDNIHNSPPVSFPGKLLAFLYQRFKIFNGDASKGMVIIPTELIPGNADKLLSIMLELAHQNGLEIAFIDWLENANDFCNSLVDRIVPGKLKEEEQAKMETELGYKDEDLIMSECYALWAIESSSEKVKNILSFADAEEGVIIAANINKFRELKLRLLNASHSFSAGLAVLSGFDTVKHAMDNELFETFLQNLMVNEIIPCIVNGTIKEEEALNFAHEVLDRYRNEFIEHKWISITMQYSSKM
jgi:tagaturonate reductase